LFLEESSSKATISFAFAYAMVGYNSKGTTISSKIIV
jgi:hypothetical protein